MEPKDTTSKVEEQGQSKLIVSNNQLRNLKSDYFIQKFFEYMSERKSLETIRYNKSIQKRINIDINHYKAYYETKTPIELDIIPMKGKYGKFININPLASPSARAPALKYGYVNTVTTSPGEVKGLMKKKNLKKILMNKIHMKIKRMMILILTTIIKILIH